MRRIQLGDTPLAHGEIGDAVHADLAAAPRLRSRPLNAVEVVFGLLLGPSPAVLAGGKIKNYSLGGPAEEAELAKCAVYLASPMSSAMTGQTLVNTCGRHI